MHRRLFMLVSIAMLLPRGALGQASIGVLPVEVGGEIAQEIAPTFEASVVAGLESAGLEVVNPAQLSAATGLDRGTLLACSSATCLDDLAESSEIDAVIRVVVSEDVDIYTISLIVTNLVGDRLEEREGACEICTTTEANDALRGLAQNLGRGLPRTGSVRLIGGTDSAEIRIDGELVSARQLDLPPGRHAVMVNGEGFDPREMTVDIPLGGEVVLDVSVDQVEDAVSSPDEAEGTGAMGIAGWVLFGVGAALTVSGVVVSALDGQCAAGDVNSQGVCENIYVDPTLGMGLGLLGGGVALAVTGLVLALVDRRRRRSRARPHISLAFAPRRHAVLQTVWVF